MARGELFFFVDSDDYITKDSLTSVSYTHLDPTLLLTKTEWKKLCHSVKEKDYILVYAMENEQDAIRIVEKLARKRTKKIIIINPYSHVRIQKGYKTCLLYTSRCV